MIKKNRKDTDYQALFNLGAIFVAVGVVFMTSLNKVLGVVFIAIGGLYMIIGSKNRDKWKEEKKKK